MPTPGSSQIVGYDMEAPLLGPTPPTPKAKVQGGPVPGEANVIVGGITHKPASRPPPTIGSLFPHFPHSSIKGYVIGRLRCAHKRFRG